MPLIRALLDWCKCYVCVYVQCESSAVHDTAGPAAAAALNSASHHEPSDSETQTSVIVQAAGTAVTAESCRKKLKFTSDSCRWFTSFTFCVTMWQWPWDRPCIIDRSHTVYTWRLVVSDDVTYTVCWLELPQHQSLTLLLSIRTWVITFVILFY